MSSNFVITRIIIDRIGLHSVLLPFLINIIAVITIIIFFKLGDISYDEKVNNVYFSFVSYLSVFLSFLFFFNNSSMLGYRVVCCSHHSDHCIRVCTRTNQIRALGYARINKGNIPHVNHNMKNGNRNIL